MTDSKKEWQKYEIVRERQIKKKKIPFKLGLEKNILSWIPDLRSTKGSFVKHFFGIFSKTIVRKCVQKIAYHHGNPAKKTFLVLLDFSEKANS
jgi:hypothetical protein